MPLRTELGSWLRTLMTGNCPLLAASFGGLRLLEKGKHREKTKTLNNSPLLRVWLIREKPDHQPSCFRQQLPGSTAFALPSPSSHLWRAGPAILRFPTATGPDWQP